MTRRDADDVSDAVRMRLRFVYAMPIEVILRIGTRLKYEAFGKVRHDQDQVGAEAEAEAEDRDQAGAEAEAQVLASFQTITCTRSLQRRAYCR